MPLVVHISKAADVLYVVTPDAYPLNVQVLLF